MVFLVGALVVGVLVLIWTLHNLGRIFSSSSSSKSLPRAHTPREQVRARKESPANEVQGRVAQRSVTPKQQQKSYRNEANNAYIRANDAGGGAAAMFQNKRQDENRRWKILLTDTEILEDYEYIFYDAIGIGRKKNDEEFEAFLMVNDPKVSKVHCSIFSYGDRLYVQDEGSSNGTFLNSQRLREAAEIEKADIISIGNTNLEVLKVFRESL